MDNNQNNKKGLHFLDFHKIRKTKDNKKILVFINDHVCFSISIKYLGKVISDQKTEQQAS